jgi:hypothetical protein
MVILLDGIEERVLWTHAIIITSCADQGRKLLIPDFETTQSASFICMVKRLKMVTHSHHDIRHSLAWTLHLIAHPGQQPFVKSLDHDALIFFGFMMPPVKRSTCIASAPES